MTQITDHLGEVRERVRGALRSCGRPLDDTTILAVSKQQPVEAIEEAFRAGQIHFGESYVQEAVPKMDRLAHLPIEWHFIGRVQANKTRPIAERFQWVHTVDRLSIALRLDRQRPHYAPPLNVLIQVNQGKEPQKGGVSEQEVERLVSDVRGLRRLRLRGLMSIPPAGLPREVVADYFKRLRALHERLREQNVGFDALSMGMSDDFELAIQEGATWVRIGTAIFGPRAA